MTRYYFHIHSAGQITPDEEGIELPSMAEARLEAHLSARDLAMAAMRGGRGVDASEIEIADGRGKILAAIAVRSSLN